MGTAGTSATAAWMRRLLWLAVLVALAAAREAAFSRNAARFGRPSPPVRIHPPRGLDDAA